MKKIIYVLIAMFVLYSLPTSAGIPMQQSFSPLVKKVGPAVVNIYTKRVVEKRMRSRNFLFNDPFFNRFFQSPGMGKTRKKIENSLGSGVIVKPDGLIATNYHVIKGATEISVIISDGRKFIAKKVLEDERTDMAILQIDTKGEKLPIVKLTDSDKVEVGDIVLAIGNPFGVGQTVTSGIVSALARTDVGIADYSFFIQTDAAINPGNSGGALIDINGNLIGLNTAIYSSTGGSLGIGFAIPSNMVKSVIRASKNGGKIVRPWVGLAGQNVTSDMLESLGMSKVQGALIQQVYPKSPAGKAGIKVGDVIIYINGKEVHDPEALKFRLATVDIGSTVKFNVLRKGKRINIDMVAEAPPEIPPREETLIKGASVLSGAVVANISPAIMAEIGELEKEEGVVILGVKGNNAANIGLRKKDIIVSVNDKAIKSVKQLTKYLKNNKLRRWSTVIQRGPRLINLTISR